MKNGMKPAICFIDDSDFEHELVRCEIAPFAPDFQFVQAHTFEEARKALEERAPALFLLDLWGYDEEVLEPSLTSREELEREIAQFPTLDQVYEGLRELKGDVYNEYLKRLFSIVDSWRSLFEKVCGRIGQNRKYGLFNLKQARLFYPDVPAVFYTRKSLINDAVAMFRAGTDGLFIKPTGRNDEETRRLTREYAPELVAQLKRIMDSTLRK
jgi:DNA-binding NarL/FixJ family response regulator